MGTAAQRLLLANLMHLQSLLFDIDGTLVDTNELHVRCWLEAFEHFGKRFEHDVMRHQIGKGGDLLVPDLLNAKEMRRFGEELKKYRTELYKRDYMPQAKPFDGARETLEALHAKGIRIALASSSNENEVEYYTQLLGVESLLAASTSKKDAEHSKPSPEIFRAALEQTGADEGRTFAVGDTPYDILAAHRIPLPIVAVLSGGFERELLAKSEFLFDDVTRIVAELKQLDDYFDD
jgi:HAD superfamily hydrolase (TIGR01549 family)